MPYAYALIDGCLRDTCVAERSVLLKAFAPLDREWTAKGCAALCVACGAHHVVTTDAPVLTLGVGDLRLALTEPERAVELVGELNGKRASIWACSVCRGAHRDPQAAEACCKPNLCRECGQGAERYWLICSSCQDAEYTRKRTARALAATKVPLAEYGHGYVWLDDHEFMEVDEWVDMPDDERPYPAWACRNLGPPKLDAMGILEGALDEYHDGVFEEIDVDGLQKALDAWSAEQVPSSYQSDETRVVILVEGSCWACGSSEGPVDDGGRCRACSSPEGDAEDKPA